MKNDEMKQKIEEICEELEIELVWIEVGRNCANRGKTCVRLRDIADSGDFAVALHEIGHTHCDPDKEPTTPRETLDAETNAWKWARERNGGIFDSEGWKRLHESLRQYYYAVMDTSHPAYELLMEAQRQNGDIRPRIPSFASEINIGGK
jgi:hypothetical protein